METEKKSNGALIGSIVIIIILLIGGIYVYQSKVQKALEEKLQSENNISMEATILDALEQDINGVDTSVEVDSVN